MRPVIVVRRNSQSVCGAEMDSSALTGGCGVDIFASMSNTNNDTDWRFYITVEVRFADIDMFLHLNNAKYLTYVESARVAYYTAVTGMTNPREFGMTVASAKLDFAKPIFFGQRVNVYTRATRIGNKSWTLDHELRDESTGELVATVSTVLVHYDYSTGQSKPIPADIVEKIEAFEGRKLKA